MKAVMKYDALREFLRVRIKGAAKELKALKKETAQELKSDNYEEVYRLASLLEGEQLALEILMEVAEWADEHDVREDL